MKPTKADLNLRGSVRWGRQIQSFEKATPKVSVVFFPPVKGMITDHFNPKEKRYAVDIAKNSPIKSVLGGTVYFADWTPNAVML